MPSFVTVHHSEDPIEAEIVRDLLVEEGYAARVVGRVGGDAEIVWGASSHVDVPAEQAAAARRAIEARLGDIRTVEADEEGPGDEPEEARARLRPVVAAGAALVIPGAGHYYARRRVLAGVILVFQISALLVARELGVRALLFSGGLLVFDLVGAQVAVRAWNRGLELGHRRQLVRAGLLLLGLGAVAAACGPLVERLTLPQRKGGPGRNQSQEIRQAPANPSQLPFPLHMDLR